MEKLISFLLSNFYFVIVVVGLLYGMFFRKGSGESKRPNQMPDFGGGQERRRYPQTPSPRPRGPGEARPGHRPQSARPAREEPRYGLPGQPAPAERPAPPAAKQAAGQEAVRPSASSPEGAYPAAGGMLDAYGEPANAYRQPAGAEPSAYDIMQPAAAGGAAAPAGPIYAAASGELNPTREDLARAIVWSEILGPPRARKPYRR